jgi:hypothetical protein
MSRRCSIALVLVATFGLTPGCTVLRIGRGPGKSSSQLALIDEQIQLQRFVDDYLARAGQALDESAERLGSDSRCAVLRLRLVLGSSVLSVGSGPNPRANLLDLVSVTVLTRMSVENYWMNTTNGAAFQPWLDASRVLETNVWELAAHFLKPAQMEELRAGIQQWYEQTPEVRTAFFARPHALVTMMRTSHEKGAGNNSVFSLFNLDPTAGLDPAVREVTQTRLMTERAMFTAQRLPFMLRLQAELLACELTTQPALQRALTNSTQISESAERVSRAVETMTRSIDLLPDRLTEERKEILSTLDVHEGKFRELVAGVNQTLVSGEKMSASLSIAITNFDALMKRFGVGEPTTNAPSRSERSDSRPFDILDYAKTADQVGNMAKGLNTLVTSANQSAPEMQRLSRQAATDLRKEVDHGFRLGLVLIAVLLAGAVPAGLLYTFFARKLKEHSAGPAP